MRYYLHRLAEKKRNELGSPGVDSPTILGMIPARELRRPLDEEPLGRLQFRDLCDAPMSLPSLRSTAVLGREQKIIRPRPPAEHLRNEQYIVQKKHQRIAKINFYATGAVVDFDHRYSP